MLRRLRRHRGGAGPRCALVRGRRRRLLRRQLHADFKRDGKAIFHLRRLPRRTDEPRDVKPHAEILRRPARSELRGRDRRGSPLVEEPPIYAAVDDVAREGGITDALLAKFEPAAKGDAILVIVVDGRTSKPKDEPVGTTTTTQAGMGGMGGRGRRHRDRSPRKSDAERSVFEMSASLYSKRLHQSAALVTMTYGGPSEDEAVSKFVAKVGATFPGSNVRRLAGQSQGRPRRPPQRALATNAASATPGRHRARGSRSAQDFGAGAAGGAGGCENSYTYVA